MTLVAPPTKEIAGEPDISPRAGKLIVASTVVMIVGMLLGMKLTGRFAVSNVAQITGTLLLFMALPRLLRPKDLVLVGLGLASVAIAAVAAALRYGYTASPFHAGYFLLATIYLVGIYRACRERSAGPAFAEGIRRAVPVSLVVLLAAYALEIAQGVRFPTLGFDDKSHGSVAACFLAFAALRFGRGPHRIVVAVALFGIALITPSRLPYTFAPFFLLALFLAYREVRGGARAAWQVYLSHLVLATAFAAPAAVALLAGDRFSAGLERVLADDGAAVASTESHLDLLLAGAELKTENLWNVLFGITPGGFAGVLYNSDVDLRLYRLPFAAIAEGTAPMHSSLGSILLEFPLWVAVGFVVLAVHAFVRLLRRREFVFASFFVALMAATTFYSSHNELFFVMCLATVLVLAYSPGRDLRRQASPAG
ncbi:hypothetical protein [Myceligenerans pegani]|uniref:Uncharacterized protein n=1 Tax=Myceligenerans pegani TaxID=2776917 RepID=A0ABR9MW54_9MICO|nr:hypothetical protein [Myceligenerans sp. TRM 65318]MBE1875226.1 hypothetical protein [Myceligenerans sp. TRM 65318]MBE3017497.1 hypothetical protein [Myceligenerans sp. TRM 65318]